MFESIQTAPRAAFTIMASIGWGLCMRPGGNLRGARVLIIEDDEDVATRLADLLVGAGCWVIGVTARLERALRLARSGNPEIVVVDVRLRGTVGFGLAAALDAPGVLFAFVTAPGSGASTGIRGDGDFTRTADLACAAPPLNGSAQSPTDFPRTGQG